MAFGLETYVNGVPVIQSVRPFNLVYSIRVINAPSTSPLTVRNFPILAGVADGTLELVLGDLGYYDVTHNLGGDGKVYARNINYSETNLSMTFHPFYDVNGIKINHGPLVFNFFRRRS